MEQNLHGARSFGIEVLEEQIARLSDPNCVFTLYVGDGFSERVIYCTGGGIRIFSTGDRCGPGLTAYLLQIGKIDEETLLSAVETSRNEKRRLREVLLSEKLLGEHDYDTINRNCIRDELLDLGFWDDAFFKVYATAPAPVVFRPDIPTLAGSSDPRQLGDEIASWVEKWEHYRKVLSSDLTVLELTESGAEAAGTAAEQRRMILEGCREGVNLRTLWRTLGLELPELYAHVVELSKWKWLSATPSVETPSEEDAMTTIAALEDSLPRAIEKDLVREKLVVLYRHSNLPEKACQHLRVLGHLASAENDWAAACERLRTVLTLRPDDLDAFEQCFKLYLDNGKKREGTIMAGHVAQALIKRRHVAALEALSTSLDAFGATPVLAQEVRGDLFALWDEKEEAIREYQDLAKKLENSGDFDRAKQMVRKALALDHRDQALRERLAELKTRSSKDTSPPTAAPRSKESVAPSRPVASALSRFSRQPSKSLILGTAGVLLITAVAYLGGFFDSGEADATTGDGGTLATPERPLAAEGTQHSSRKSPPEIEPPVVPRPTPPPDLLACSIGRRMRARFAHSRDLVVEDVNTGDPLLRLYANEGDDWSIGIHGEVICRWKPGATAVLYHALSGNNETVLRWRLPEGTVALAVSNTAIAIREGDSTGVYSLDGTLLRKKTLPRWDRGVFSGTTLILVAEREDGNGSRESWIVDAQSLDVLWSS